MVTAVLTLPDQPAAMTRPFPAAMRRSRCRSLTIDFETPTNLNADGEMSESTHVDAAIVPLALPLILPRVKK